MNMNRNRNAIFTLFCCSFSLQEELKEAMLPMHKKETEKETVLEEVNCSTFSSSMFYRICAYFRLCNMEKMATKAIGDQKIALTRKEKQRRLWFRKGTQLSLE